MNRFFSFAEKVTLFFPDWITGNTEVFRKKYYRKYGHEKYDHIILKRKTTVMLFYLIIAFVGVLVLLAHFAGQLISKEELNSIKRPDTGEVSRSVPVEVHLQYKNVELIRNVRINVGTRELTKSEKEKVIANYGRKLNTIIAGKNKDLNNINKSLNLITQDTASGISIHWTSDRPDLIGEDGGIDSTRVNGRERVELTADISLDGVSKRQIYDVTLIDSEDKDEIMDGLSVRLNKEMDKIVGSGYTQVLSLPDDLGDGIRVKWFLAEENSKIILLPILLILLLMIFFKRYDSIDKEIKEAEESMLVDLPEFINKLVLLLNAGLVVSTAFEKIAKDHQKNSNEKSPVNIRKRYLYDQLTLIQFRVDKSNTSLIRELKAFSQRCGVREMVRITAIITDNWNKGSALADKLEGESELLWVSRKKKAEEKGKLAETKLIFPMVILLMVLIVIVIAPAMMEM